MARNDQITIRNLRLRGIVGINDWEREKLQDILVNISLGCDLAAAGASDKIEDTLNYRSLTKAIIEYVEGSEHYLVEALASEIASICLSHGASRARVRIEKPGALRFADSVGVEVDRTPEDFS